MAIFHRNLNGVLANISKFRQLSPLSFNQSHTNHLRILLSSYGTFPVKMPALSPTMVSGHIKEWCKKEGEAITAGEILCEIETDKAVVSLEADEDGKLAKILYPEGSKDITLGTMIAVMVDEDEDWTNVVIPQAETVSQIIQQETSLHVPSSVEDKHQTVKVNKSYGPAVRSLLDVYGLMINEVPATGPYGRLLKGDILRFIEVKKLAPLPPPIIALPVLKVDDPDLYEEGKTSSMQIEDIDEKPVEKPVEKSVEVPLYVSQRLSQIDKYSDVRITSMRRTIANRLTESKRTIPHMYSSVQCQIDELLALKNTFAKDKVKVSLNDFIIKSSALTLQKLPHFNAIWKDGSAHRMESIDISIAVATDGGLITPIVKKANGMGIEGINQEVKNLALKARAGKLKPDEFIGGSFTISNLGMFGIKEFSAVINPPQACILAVGNSNQDIMPDGSVHNSMSFVLSSDARVVNEHDCDEFLSTLKKFIENPSLMLSSLPASRNSESDKVLPLDDLNVDMKKLFAR